jgi:Tat protein translocase TatB subunit
VRRLLQTIETGTVAAMFGISGFEMLVVMIVVLLVFGPKELPDAMRKAGNAMKAVNKMRVDVQRQLDAAMRDIEKEGGLDELKKSVGEVRKQVAASTAGRKPAAPAPAVVKPEQGSGDDGRQAGN